MKKIFYILIILFLTSCSNNGNYIEKKDSIQNSFSIDYDVNFNTWLSKHDLTSNDIIDSISESATGLMTYDDITQEDSLYFRYPSTDSSFILLTNYDNKTNNRKRIGTEYIQLKFLDTKKRKVYQGIILLEEDEKREIDYYWYDSILFYYMEVDKDSISHSLTKFKMKVDSIWHYRMRINNKNVQK